MRERVRVLHERGEQQLERVARPAAARRDGAPARAARASPAGSRRSAAGTAREALRRCRLRDTQRFEPSNARYARSGATSISRSQIADGFALVALRDAHVAEIQVRGHVRARRDRSPPRSAGPPRR